MDQKRRKSPRETNSPIAFGSLLLLLVMILVASWARCRSPEESGREAQDVLAFHPARKNARLDRKRTASVCQVANRRRDEPFQTGEGDVAAPAVNESDGAERLAEGERLAEEFYRETDRWTREAPVSVDDVQQFVRKFSAVPRSRKGACLHRALNLIPDVNVSLLAGVLLDRSQPKSIVKEVFNDIANRSEEVKDPILRAICENKSHPCYDDARWIFEVTGEVPK